MASIERAVGQMRHYYGNYTQYRHSGNVKELGHPELGEWIEAVERAQARIAELEAALNEKDAQLGEYVKMCSDCDSVQLCSPEGYDWSWTCADTKACEARQAAKPPPPPRVRHGLGGMFAEIYERQLLENARRHPLFAPRHKADDGDE